MKFIVVSVGERYLKENLKFLLGTYELQEIEAPPSSQWALCCMPTSELD